MQGTLAGPADHSADTCRAALGFAHHLLSRPPGQHVALDALLGEVATAFAAPAAGLATLRDGNAIVPHAAAGGSGGENGRGPWETDPVLLARIRQAPAALPVPRPEGGSYLATALARAEGGWLLWLADEQRPTWTEAESATLTLIGQLLTRFLAAAPPPRWAAQLQRAALQQQMENAAAVARRLAHDFGNVLTSILGFSELALTQQVTPGTPLHSYLTEVHRGAQNGAHLTDRLRLFARRQSGSPCPAALAGLLAGEEARLRTGAEAGLGLQVFVPPDLPPVAVDADNLRQVVAVLLDNAREALGGPGTIRVRARLSDLTEVDCRDYLGSARPGAHVEVSITDTGAGLSAEAARRLFAEPFFSTKPRGRGFGLAIAYGILHANHGGLRLDPAPERGTVARFVVPLAPAAATAGPGPGRADRILVVDDDPMILRFVAMALEGAGYRVQAFTRAEDARTAYVGAGEDRFRLVLSDVIMPGTSGVDLARQLLAHDANVRMFFMSGRVSADFLQGDLARQQFGLLLKPFRPEELLRAVRQALDRPGPRLAGAADDPGKEPVLSVTC